jgi:hypothetical protein
MAGAHGPSRWNWERRNSEPAGSRLPEGYPTTVLVFKRAIAKPDSHRNQSCPTWPIERATRSARPSPDRYHISGSPYRIAMIVIYLPKEF